MVSPSVENFLELQRGTRIHIRGARRRLFSTLGGWESAQKSQVTDLGEHTGCHSREIMTINTNAGCSQDELDPARRRVSTDALGRTACSQGLAPVSYPANVPALPVTHIPHVLLNRSGGVK